MLFLNNGYCYCELHCIGISWRLATKYLLFRIQGTPCEDSNRRRGYICCASFNKGLVTELQVTLRIAIKFSGHYVAKHLLHVLSFILFALDGTQANVGRIPILSRALSLVVANAANNSRQFDS